jgi:hypothetical protein
LSTWSRWSVDLDSRRCAGHTDANCRDGGDAHSWRYPNSNRRPCSNSDSVPKCECGADERIEAYANSEANFHAGTHSDCKADANVAADWPCSFAIRWGTISTIIHDVLVGLGVVVGLAVLAGLLFKLATTRPPTI